MATRIKRYSNRNPSRHHWSEGLFTNEADAELFLAIFKKFTRKQFNERQTSVANYHIGNTRYTPINKFGRKEEKETWLTSFLSRLGKIEYVDYKFQTSSKYNGTLGQDLIGNIVSEPNSDYASTPKIILKEALRIESIIKDIYKNNKLMYSITPTEYEEVIAELLKKQKFDVQLTKRTRDGGFDIIAIQGLGKFSNKYLVECKRNREDRPIGINVIRSFSDVIKTNNVNKGIICTTSYFSEEAKERERLTPYLLELKDRFDILDWVSDYIQKP